MFLLHIIAVKRAFKLQKVYTCPCLLRKNQIKFRQLFLRFGHKWPNGETHFSNVMSVWNPSRKEYRKFIFPAKSCLAGVSGAKVKVFPRFSHSPKLTPLQVKLVRLQRRQAALFPPMKVADAAQLAAAATLTTPAREWRHSLAALVDESKTNDFSWQYPPLFPIQKALCYNTFCLCHYDPN